MQPQTFTALLANLLFAPVLSAAPVTFFDFDNDAVADANWTVTAGDTFTVDVYVSNVDNAHSGLLSWGVELDFSQSLLSGNSYSIAPAWPFAGVNNQIDNTSGKAELLASALTGSTGSMALFSIEFTATDAGVAALSLQELYPSNASFTGFAGADGYDYDAEVVFDSVNVTINPVPLPASLWLFASGLAGLFVHARRKRNA